MVQSNDQKIILFWPLQNSWSKSATGVIWSCTKYIQCEIDVKIFK